MIRSTMLFRIALLALIPCVTSHAAAQTSVTLYGSLDDGLVYVNNQSSLGSTAGGKSANKLVNGILTGSKFGLTGQEDLGRGTKAIFRLESGFNIDTGSAQFANELFGYVASVGVTNNVLGTLTAGRQYTPYWTLLLPYSPTLWLTGFSGAHPGDVDSMDNNYRMNNSLVYTSPSIYGFTMSGAYALGGVAGSINTGSTWSLALQYLNGPFGIAAAVLQINNSNTGGGDWGAASTTNSNGQIGVSAVTNGYQTAAAQQRIAVTGGYEFTQNLGISMQYTNVQYVPGVSSKFRDEAIFNTIGTVLHYQATPSILFATGYSYTRATKANGIDAPAQYHQFSLRESYSLSKRTLFYALQGFQVAHGKTLGTPGSGSVIDATATIGDGFNGVPSSSNRQFTMVFGINHKF
jgi:predicted porin